jgi:hypothetical protein
LEETAAIVGRAGDEECAGARSSGGDRHAAIVRRIPSPHLHRTLTIPPNPPRLCTTPSQATGPRLA